MTYFDYSVCSACLSEVGDGEFFAHRCPPDRPRPLHYRPCAGCEEVGVLPVRRLSGQPGRSAVSRDLRLSLAVAAIFVVAWTTAYLIYGGRT